MRASFNALCAGVLLFSAAVQPCAAQNQAGEIIKAGAADANLLGKAYLKPLFNGLGIGLNQGWASTAAVKTGHVSLKLLAGLSFVTDMDRQFDATTLGLSPTVKVNGSGISPTVTGNDVPGAQLDVYANNPVTGRPQKVTTLNSPNGTGISFVPVVFPQLSVGLPFSTEVSIRLIPAIQIGGAKVQMYGGALKHDLSRYIPLLPINLSVLAGYTQATLNYNLTVQPDPAAAPTLGSDYSNQKLNLMSSSLTLGVVASKTFAVLTVHGGIQYTHSSGLLTATGTYPITTYNALGSPQTTDIKDPIHINSDPLSGVNANLGIQLRLAFFSILAEGSLGTYSSVNGGIGFSF